MSLLRLFDRRPGAVNFYRSQADLMALRTAARQACLDTVAQSMRAPTRMLPTAAQEERYIREDLLELGEDWVSFRCLDRDVEERRAEGAAQRLEALLDLGLAPGLEGPCRPLHEQEGDGVLERAQPRLDLGLVHPTSPKPSPGARQ